MISYYLDHSRIENDITVLHEPSYSISSNPFGGDNYLNKNIHSNDFSSSIQKYPQVYNSLNKNKMTHGIDLSASIQEYDLNYASNPRSEYSANGYGLLHRRSSEQQFVSSKK